MEERVRQNGHSPKITGICSSYWLSVCVCVLCVCVCACQYLIYVNYPSTQRWHPLPTPPCGRSVHSETAWKPHLKSLPPQHPGTLRLRDLILHWDWPETYLWSIFFNLINLWILNLSSSKGIKGAQLCSQFEKIYHLWAKRIVITMWLTWSKYFAPTVFNNSDLTTYTPL